MFIHNFKYTLKTLFRNKALIFWTFAFPIIIGTFFNMAFSNIENSEKLDIINIAIVDNDNFKNNEIFKETFKTLSDEENEDRLFNTQYVSEEKAKELLDDDQIVGYLKMENDEPKIVIHTNGINATILKYVAEEVEQTQKIIETILKDKIEEAMVNITPDKMNQIESIYTQVYENISKSLEESNVKIKNISNENLSYTMIEFYSLIAMTCLYGGIIAMVAINQNLANMSSKGKRASITPISKGKIVLGSMLASYIVQLIGVALLFLYTIFVLKVDYGTNLPLMILLGLVGSLAGLSMGMVITTILKTNENVKMGIILAVTMLGCFLSGMLGITMKYIIDKNIPIINKLNPASMITDGFYSLYYYTGLDRYWFNIFSLLAFSAVLLLISYFSLRRKRYDSV